MGNLLSSKLPRFIIPASRNPIWEHRILLCKALGMNTICLYVFWNLHETEPDNLIFPEIRTLQNSAVWPRNTACM